MVSDTIICWFELFGHGAKILQTPVIAVHALECIVIIVFGSKNNYSLLWNVWLLFRFSLGDVKPVTGLKQPPKTEDFITYLNLRGECIAAGYQGVR